MSSNEKWISLRNAAVRIIDPSNVRPDSVFENAIGWPEIDENDERLKEFIAAAIENRIDSEGMLGKASFGAHENYHPKFNRKRFAKRLIEWELEFDEAMVNDRHYRNPFIVGYAYENSISKICPNHWQKDGVIWMRSTLILHEDDDIPKHRSKVLDAGPPNNVFLEMAELHPEAFNNDTEVPAIHMYQHVHICVASLDAWLSEANKLSNIITEKRPVGRPKRYQWKYVDEFALEFIDAGTPYASQMDFYHALVVHLKEAREHDNLFVEPILSNSSIRSTLPNKIYWPRLEPLYHNSYKARLV